MNKEEGIRKEIIGTQIEINGVTGIVIDETKNMIMVRDKKGKTKKFIKKNHKFIIHTKEKIYEINGKDIALRPEERIMVK